VAGAELPEPEDDDEDVLDPDVLDAAEVLDESDDDELDELSLLAEELELLLPLLDFDESRLSLR
jgi:hypothetical protein